MHISFNWLKKYIKLQDSLSNICNALTIHGLEVSSVENFSLIPETILIGNILDIKPHSNADKLKLVDVEIGSDNILKIVCGASNLFKDQKVVVATVGTQLKVGDSVLTIKQSKIRGEISEGMLCSEAEIRISTKNDGIMELPADAPVGKKLCEYLNILPDQILEIDVTPNRGDALSHIGIARELDCIYPGNFILPQIKHHNCDLTQEERLHIKIDNINSHVCPRYAIVSIENVNVAESPIWLKSRLLSIGLKPINNVVDITNLVMHEIGQPIHAYDYSAIKFPISVNFAKNNTPFETINNKKLNLTDEDLVIQDSNQHPLALAGIIGGSSSAVKSSTKNIVIESAYFSQTTLANSVKLHGISTDSAYRYCRGVDPSAILQALNRAIELVISICGGQLASDIIEFYPNKLDPKPIKIYYNNIDNILHTQLNKQEIHKTLSLMSVRTSDLLDDSFIAYPPTYKFNIKREIDLIAEFIRIYKYKNLKNQARTLYCSVPYDKTQKYQLKYDIATYLASQGYYEIITKSLTSPTNSNTIELEKNQQVVLANPGSELMSALKQTLLFEGLKVISYNINRSQTDIKFFEFGKTYHFDNGEYIEKQKIGIWLTGNDFKLNWLKKPSALSVFDIKATANNIFRKLGIKDIIYKSHSQNYFSEMFDGSFSIIEKQSFKNLGFLGTVNKAILKAFEIEQEIFFMEIELDSSLNNASLKRAQYEQISPFPYVKRDLSLVINEDIDFARINYVLLEDYKEKIDSLDVIDVYKGNFSQTRQKTYTLRFIFKPRNKTLKSAEIDFLMDSIIKTCETKLNAIIRR
jgi:phenylalanyl-tRNA synthetase beta chain